jgi:uncharacterized protein YdeI (YjbR/CyaY-like superfamily)
MERFETPARLRAWFAKNHATEPELVLAFWKLGSGKPSVTYQEALDEALCVGWIDGVRRRVDDESYTIRFTPRRARSIWSAVNLARVKVLEKEGRMKDAGRKALAERDPALQDKYAHEQEAVAFDAAQQKAFKADKAAWAWFSEQTEGYRRIATWHVVSAKKAETRARRLAELIARSAKSERLPQFVPAKPKKP